MMSYRSMGQVSETEPMLPPDVAPTLLHDLVRPEIERQRGWIAVPAYDMTAYLQTQLVVALASFTVGVGMGALFGNFLGGRRGGSPVRNPRRRTGTGGKRVLRAYLIRTGGGSYFEVRAYSRESALQQARREEKCYPVQIVRSEIVKNAGKRRVSRRTSARRRPRGRPTGGRAHEPGMTVTIDRVKHSVDVLNGDVMYAGRRMGSVYDLGTSYRAVPRHGESRSFGTLAGAVKHVIRASEAA